jgi:tripartite-type tricarboxylate transporter receptor subunit TctC
MRATGWCRAAAILLAGLVAGGVPAAAQTAEPFYRGKTISIVVGFTPGGTYDTDSRLLARHLGRHLPGNPAVIVQNMVGAGSSSAILHLYRAAAHDGTVIGMVARNYPIDPLFSKTAIEYDPQRFNPIGSTSSDLAVAAVWFTSPIKRFDQLFTTPITAGATAYVDNTGRFPLLTRNLTGAKIKIVIGYPGGNEVSAAVERGEVDASFGWSWGSLKSRAKAWLDDKKLTLIFQLGLKKAPDLPTTPSIMDYAKTERDRQALELLFAPQAFAWPFIAPPDLPSDRLATLRRGFDETMKDSAFLADAAKLGIEIDPVTGEEMASLIRRILSFDPSAAARVEELLTVER